MAATLDLNRFFNLSSDLVEQGKLAIQRAHRTLIKADQVIQQKSNELIKIGIKKSQELPEILINQMEKDPYSIDAVLNPRETILYNTALGTLSIAISIHRNIVNTKEEITAKERGLIAAGYLFAFSNLAVYFIS